MQLLKKLEDTVSSWPQISVHPHRFGGREFRLEHAEVGHVHPGGIVDIPFPRSIRDALLAEGLAEEHHWVPNSGWITFRVRGEEDLQHAVWLMRLSYFRYALKTASDPHELFAQANRELQLTNPFNVLLEQFVGTPKNQGVAS
ncbi:MAG TPA: luciferase family protein [Candidatus Acidoferrum sp.]